MNRMILGLVALLAWPAGAFAQEGEPEPTVVNPRVLRGLQLAPPRLPALPVDLEAEPAEGDELEGEAAPAEAFDAQPEDDLLLEDPDAEAAEAIAAPEGESEAAEDEPAELFADDGFGASEAQAQETETAAETTIPAADPNAEPAEGPNYPAMIFNFLVWLAIVFFLLRKPLTEFLKSRRQAVVEGLEESKRIREAAEAKHAEYTEKLAHLDEELAKLRKEMIQAGEAERDRIIAEAEARAARMRRDAQFLIDQQMKQLKADLTREAIEAAVKAAEEALGAQTSPGDQQRLAKAYLSDLGASMKKDEVQA